MCQVSDGPLVSPLVGLPGPRGLDGDSRMKGGTRSGWFGGPFWGLAGEAQSGLFRCWERLFFFSVKIGGGVWAALGSKTVPLTSCWDETPSPKPVCHPGPGPSSCPWPFFSGASPPPGVFGSPGWCPSVSFWPKTQKVKGGASSLP